MCLYVHVFVCNVVKEEVEVNGVVGSEFDPSTPAVLFLLCKWYRREVEVARLLVSL